MWSVVKEEEQEEKVEREREKREREASNVVVLAASLRVGCAELRRISLPNLYLIWLNT